MLLQPFEKRKSWPAAATEGSWEEEKLPVLAGGKSLGQTLQKWFQEPSKALLCSTKPTQGYLGRIYSSSISAPRFPVSCSLSFHINQKSEEKQLKDKASINKRFLEKQA